MHYMGNNLPLDCKVQKNCRWFRPIVTSDVSLKKKGLISRLGLSFFQLFRICEDILNTSFAWMKQHFW